MIRQPLSTVAVAVALACAGTWATAQSTGATGGGTTGTGSSMTGGGTAPAVQAGTGTRNAETNKDDKLARGDRQFILDAAGSGMFEVQAAQLASTKATDPSVKSYASKLVDEHTAANDELVKIANARKVELPAAPPRSMRREVEKLGKASGKEFDQQFVRDVGIKAHEKDIKSFEKASEKVKDPQLKEWVTKTLPHLREHLAMAQKLPQSGAKSSAAAMGNGGTTTGAAKPEVGTATPKGAATGTNTGAKTGS